MSRSTKKEKLLGQPLKEAIRVLGLPEGVLAQKLTMYRATTGTTHVLSSYSNNSYSHSPYSHKTACGKATRTLTAVEVTPLEAFKLCGSCVKAQESYMSRNVFGEGAERYQKRVQLLWRAVQHLEKIEASVVRGEAGEGDAAMLQKILDLLRRDVMNSGVTNDVPLIVAGSLLSDASLALEVGEENVELTRERFSAILHEISDRVAQCIPKVKESASSKGRDGFITEAALVRTAQLVKNGGIECPGVDWLEVGNYRDLLVASWLQRSRIAPILNAELYRAAFSSTQNGAAALTCDKVTKLPHRYRCDPSKYTFFQDLVVAEFNAMWDETFAAMLATLNGIQAEQAARTDEVYLAVDLVRHGRNTAAWHLSKELYEKLITVVPAVAANRRAGVYRLPRIVAEALAFDLGPTSSKLMDECSPELAELAVGLMETSTENHSMERWFKTAENILV
jgi:hypothetical protein